MRWLGKDDRRVAAAARWAKGATRVVKDYEDIPEIECRPKELNQVFMIWPY